MSTGAIIGAIMLATSVGFFIGLWWHARIRKDIMQEMDEEIQAAVERILNRVDKH